MNVLALDLGTQCGWALLESGRVESGVQVFDVKRGESPGMRWLRFNRWLEEMTTPAGPVIFLASGRQRWDLIVYEAVLGRFARGQAQTHIASNFAGRVEEFCARYALEHAAVPGATLKKFVTGKGNANKEAMQAAAFRRGWIPWTKDDNEVDALCLLHYAQAELVPGGAP